MVWEGGRGGICGEHGVLGMGVVCSDAGLGFGVGEAAG